MKKTLSYIAVSLIGVFIGYAFCMATYKSDADWSQGCYDCLIDVEAYSSEKRQSINLDEFSEVK